MTEMQPMLVVVLALFEKLAEHGFLAGLRITDHDQGGCAILSQPFLNEL
jgi:hypothetical protein